MLCGSSNPVDSLAAFAAKLRDGAAPSGVSKYIREHLSQETVQKLGTANDDLRSALAEDLNRIIETEYEAARYLSSKKEELNALRAANKTGDAEDLQKEIAAPEGRLSFTYRRARVTLLQTRPQSHGILMGD